MSLLSALPAIAASLIASSPAAVAVEPPNDTQGLETGAIAPDLADPNTEILDLNQDRARRYTVPVMIEGQGPFNFMIDTGSQATAVTSQINRQLGLKPSGTATLVGMASRRPVELVEVDEMSFGQQTVYDLISPVLDANNVGAHGILGLDSLQDYRVLLDFREETIAVQDVSSQSNYRKGFEIIVRANPQFGQLLITDAVVEGVRATVIIDTGAQASIGSTALREKIRRKRAQEVVTTDVNGVSMTGQMQALRSLKIGGLELANVALTFADTPAFEALGLGDKPVLALGMQHLRFFDRVAIDFSEKRVLFDVPRDVARAIRRNRRGTKSFGF
ncbi:aspartyl protease family protein [Erythrobacter sp. SCSIO 43205]|uniref:retroviral-like aspartic protease family protein n=1 Tax=Erythrobacter sp. SCSIO 43205 TaxID=2779361 RepID=UPI001CA91D61|nr:retroviral-like aspartic protease family protein [Erythrobacter sp. SCSIO 43205]UAB78889.1 aspartyl protease family protein [Erythrobacter sp. SCSIO 43205]